MSNYKYAILKELQLVLIIFKNEVTFKGLKELIKKLNIDVEFKISYKILIDLRLSKIDMTFDEVERFSNCIHKSTKLDTSFLISFFTETPEQVVTSTIYSSNNLQYKVLSTLEASLNHLNVKASNFEMIDKRIKNYK
ncbi:hypothetical protein [uncultured Lutibacter sp.]|mgnify:CR=1 FL=1|uniref:hypothetical protein n=1 Tax=uncultured Lutibacter sp. TaxID=437739 RepID=UPI00262E7420|nr:hypothetical protein [uncultured Lutibacter sp.]